MNAAVARQLTPNDEAPVRPEHVIVQLLRNGKPVSAKSIHVRLADIIDVPDIEARMPLYVAAIKQHGGQMRVFKSGRSIIAYQLLNPKMFNRYGMPTRRAHEEGLDVPTVRHEVVIQP